MLRDNGAVQVEKPGHVAGLDTSHAAFGAHTPVGDVAVDHVDLPRGGTWGLPVGVVRNDPEVHLAGMSLEFGERCEVAFAVLVLGDGESDEVDAPAGMPAADGRPVDMTVLMGGRSQMNRPSNTSLLCWLAGAWFRARAGVSKLQVVRERVCSSLDWPSPHGIRLAGGQICRQGAMTGAP